MLLIREISNLETFIKKKIPPHSLRQGWESQSPQGGLGRAGLPMLLPWCLPGPMGCADPIAWADREGRAGSTEDREGQGASSVGGGGCLRAECLARAKPRLKSHRGEVREGRRGTAYIYALLGRAGVEMGRDSSARGDTCSSSHHENSKRKPATEVGFHLGALPCFSLAGSSHL